LSSSTGAGSKGLNNIQALRAVAALLVVVDHLDVFLPMVGWTPFGYGGVDLFFVISGFIMVYTTIGRPTRPVDFLSNRIARIVPLYWLITLAVYSVALVAPAWLRHTSADPYQLLMSLFFIPFAKTKGDIQPLLFVGWTLNLEMFFYVVFAGGLAFANRRVGILAVVVSLAGLVAARAVFQPSNVAVEFYTRPLILEFAGGMVLCLFVQWMAAHPLHLSRRVWTGVCIVCLVAIAAVPSSLPQLSVVITAGVPALACVAAAVFLNQSGVVVRNRLLLMLGNASYSIYLTHPFITQAMQQIGVRMGLNPLRALLLIPVSFGLVCLAGIVLHYALEIPLTRAARRLLDWILGHRQPKVCPAS
jgi:exopolysaccharide production protein ExoZ